MVIIMDMETGQLETAPRHAAEPSDEIACAGWVDVPPPLQHQLAPRLAERIAEPDAELLQRAYRAQRG